MAIALALNATSCRHSNVQDNLLLAGEVDSVPEPTKLYGLEVDSFIIESSKVGRRDLLSSILDKAGLDRQMVYNVSQAVDKAYSVRQIKRGNSYTLFYSCPTDSTRELKHFVYDVDATTYLRCDIFSRDSIIAQLAKNKIRTEEQIREATIETNLWNATRDNGMPPTIALELSDIYAWTVNFFGIEKGDRFKVLYTEDFVDSTSIGIGQIKAAKFLHHGKEYYAFRFESDSTTGYYDAEGNSLKRAFLKAPLKYSRISSKFSHSRLHPVLKTRRAHHGVDYAAPSGTPVMAIGDGQVIAKGFDSKGGGNYIKIRHNSVYTTVYMHLRGFAKGISNGSMVSQSDVIGYVGKTGTATGPHLDFRVYVNGQPVDPLTMEAPSGEPVSNDNVDEFIIYADSLRNIIDEQTETIDIRN